MGFDPSRVDSCGNIIPFVAIVLKEITIEIFSKPTLHQILYKNYSYKNYPSRCVQHSE
jgi:hypothetical protein